MTKLQSWLMTGLAIAVLGIGVVLASSAISSAQEGTETPTPSPTEESTGDGSTPTPSQSEESDDADGSGSEEEDEDSAEKRGCGGGGKYLVKEAAAEVLGLSEDEVREALRDGQSLAELAEAQGMSVEDFSAALLENITAYLREELDEGEITQEQFDEITADLNENLDDIINSEGGFRFHHRFENGEAEESEGNGTGFRAPFQRAPVAGGI